MSGKAIAKNSIYLITASILQKILAFFYFVVLTRNLPTETVGIYTFALSFCFIFAVFIDFGFNSLLIKETARDEKNINKYASYAILFKLVSGILFCLVGATIAYFSNYDFLKLQTVLLGFILVFIDGFTTTFYSILRGKQKIFFESLGLFLYQFLIFLLGYLAIKGGITIPTLMFIPIIAITFAFLFSLYFLRRETEFKFDKKLSWKFFKTMFIMALPFAATGICTKLYSSIDTVLISTMINDTNVAWYQAAYKIVFALYFIPNAIGAAIFPAFSNYFQNNKEKLNITFEKAFLILSIMSIPMTFGLYVLAEPIVLLIYPNYIPTIPVLKTFSIIFFFLFLNVPSGLILSSCNKQILNTRNSFLSMLINIILNIILITRYQIVGAAIASVISFVFLFFINTYGANKIIDIKIKKILSNIFRIILASFIMSLFTYFSNINIFLNIVISSGIYFMMLFALKVLTKNQIKSWIKIFIKKS
ncbi:flippase [Patescibacteria group bacterium]|nr:flippase [Patescibacteria group bacterium]